MEPMGTIREKRFKELRKDYHLLQREAMELSKIDYNDPSAIYIKNMLTSIKQSYESHITRGGTPQTWSKSVIEAYKRKGFLTQQLRGKKTILVIDVWQRVRSVEDQFKALDKNADWASPHLKKWSDFRQQEKELDKALGY